MLIRKTSAPAWNKRPTTVRLEEAGPSVATTFVRRCRLIDFGPRAERSAPRARPAGAVAAPGGAAGVSGLPVGNGRCGACSVDSVSCTVQARCSPVSTSKKPRAVEAARQTIADAADGEFLVARAHNGLSHPFAAAIVVDGVDIIITGNKISLEHGLAGARRQIPPAFRGPAVGVLVADGDADPVAGVVAKAEIRRGWADRCRQHEHCK